MTDESGNTQINGSALAKDASEAASTPIADPVRRAAELIADADCALLERRLKSDIFTSIGRIKPAIVADVDFDTDVMIGDWFGGLSPPLQGIAIARTEGALAFYNRVGWHVQFLDEPMSRCVPEDGLQPLQQRYHASTLHDLAYVHPKHFEKILGKAGAASLWETLKRYATDPETFANSQST